MPTPTSKWVSLLLGGVAAGLLGGCYMGRHKDTYERNRHTDVLLVVNEYDRVESVSVEQSCGDFKLDAEARDYAERHAAYRVKKKKVRKNKLVIKQKVYFDEKGTLLGSL